MQAPANSNAKAFFEKDEGELTDEDLANAQTYFHQALVRYYTLQGRNPFTPEVHGLITHAAEVMAKLTVRKARALRRKHERT